MPAARISVVVITKNQRPFLERSLPAVAAQEGVPHGVEVVVVDSGSADGAREFALKCGAGVVDIAPEAFGYARAHNAGAAAAVGDIVVRLSGDAVPAGTCWLAALCEPFSDPAVAAVWGRQVIPERVRNPLERWFEARHRPDTPVRYPRDVTVLGCNMAYRRRLWEEHAFDERLPQAEDYAWMHHWYRQGYVGVYTPAAAVVHGHAESLPAALRRSLSQSVLQGLILLGVYDRRPARRAAAWR